MKRILKPGSAEGRGKLRIPRIDLNPQPPASSSGEIPRSPRWSQPAKILVGLTMIFLAAGLVFRFESLIQLLIIAGIVAFLLSPIIRLLSTRTRLSWRGATHIVFLFLVLILAIAFAATSLALVQEVQSLVLIIQAVLRDVPGALDSIRDEGLALGPIRLDFSSFDLAAMANQAALYVRPVVGEASGWVTAVAGGAIESIARSVFVLAAAYFLTLDQPAITDTWKRGAIPGYEYDWARLRRGLDRIWSAFLRGQIVLGLIIAVVVTFGLSVLGVRNALVLGLVSGLLEFIPIAGPVIAGGIAAVVAFFQGSNWWGLSPEVFTLLVIAFFIVIQQLENNLLVPRIMGTALRLHPVVVLIAAVIGATLAGILGILLSAPTMATLMFLGRYVHRKIFDLPPWEPPIDDIVQEAPEGTR